jgi:cysteine desulfurase / selenocysteine lyase
VSGEKLPESIRQDFPALNNRRNGKPPIYFDNACTTLVPTPVIESMTEYYTHFSACGGHRSRYWFAEEVNDRIEGNSARGIKGSRLVIRDFIHARSEKEIIFALNTSHAINMVALGFRFKPDDMVLITGREHNSNLVPWLRLQNNGVIKVDHVETSPDEFFSLEAFEEKLKHNQVRLVSMGYTSNLTGYTLPASEIIRLAHRYGARVLLDGAQTVPHQPVDVQALDVDFLAFSIHKMCGPRGVGVLYGKQEILGQGEHEEEGFKDVVEPVMLGGGTILDSEYDSYSLLKGPERFEAGLQNYSGLIAAGEAVNYLQKIGLDRIHEYEIALNSYLTQQLLERHGDTGWFNIVGPQEANQRGGLLTFEVRRPNAVGLAAELSQRNNIMVRDGAFCVHSYLNHVFGRGWTRPRMPAEHRMTYRVSLYFYNTLEECRVFVETLDQIFRERSYI